MSLEVGTAGPRAQRSRGRMGSLMLGAVGIVYGDIGTSPLYTLKTVFSIHTATRTADVLGILSLIFWSLMIVVTLKFVFVIMRADNKGEGGVLALSALARQGLGRRAAGAVAALGLLGMALFMGDSLITPAISVLSAIEGIDVAAPGLASFVVPVTLAIIVGLFVIQSWGTEIVGKLFGPVMIAWFAAIALLGLAQVVRHPGVLAALLPSYGAAFFLANGWTSFFVLGGVVLAVTGGEALYADMGHFGRRPIAMAWLYFVLPSLVLNYFGQGALLLADPDAIQNPFYLLAPSWATWPLLLLAAMATVIASQAVISGAFSVTQQAIQMNYLPRREVRHTSDHAMGQIYIPRTNWLLMVGVILLVVGFRTSDSLGSAYGISVVGTMTIDAVLAFFVAVNMWKWPVALAVPLFGMFVAIDLTFLAANLNKVLQGGWFPLVVAACSFTMMHVWRKGRQVLFRVLHADSMPVADFVARSLGRFSVRTPGTAVFLTGDNTVVPLAMLHNIKHNKVLHERVFLLTVHSDDEPYREPEDQIAVEELGRGFWRLDVHFGFMDRPDVPKAMEQLARSGIAIDPMDTSFFLGYENLMADKGKSGGLNRYEEPLFIALSKMATGATGFFSLPPNRVVVMGSQVYI